MIKKLIRRDIISEILILISLRSYSNLEMEQMKDMVIFIRIWQPLKKKTGCRITILRRISKHIILRIHQIRKCFTYIKSENVSQKPVNNPIPNSLTETNTRICFLLRYK